MLNFFSFFCAVDTEIPIIKHSSSPPALPTHNQPQISQHQNQQQTHHPSQRNHLQTAHHHQQQQQQKQVSPHFYALIRSFVFIRIFFLLLISPHNVAIIFTAFTAFHMFSLNNYSIYHCGYSFCVRQRRRRRRFHSFVCYYCSFVAAFIAISNWWLAIIYPFELAANITKEFLF